MTVDPEGLDKMDAAQDAAEAAYREVADEERLAYALTREETAEVSPEEPKDVGPELGWWYWVLDDKGVRNLWCVTHVGSNFVKVEHPNGGQARILFEDLAKCARELAPDAYIERRIVEYRQKLDRLTGEIRELTTSLGVAPMRAITDGTSTETQALARVGLGRALPEYKAALVKAKEKTLPALFEAIRTTTEAMARWMTAQTLPLKAQAGSLKGLVEGIEGRIFNVELYAGLVESIADVAEGVPAASDAPIHLMQRRCYMDEECLARYETGGMEFQDIEAFDRWLARPDNRDRILPFPRCIVAFRVRRNEMARDAMSLSDFITFGELARLDKTTFLYVRNGDKLHRVSTGIDFGDWLFPDTEAAHLTSGEPLWARVFCEKVDSVITQGHYDDLVAEREADEARYERELAVWKAMTVDERKVAGTGSPFRRHGTLDCYERYSQDSPYYDDIARHIGKAVDHYNRIVLVLQGLLDRSLVLHPHPPWRLWIPEEFERAFILVRDGRRALVAGPAPDFEAYRRRLNKSLTVGSVTFGQRRAWAMVMAEKENERRAHDWRLRDRDHALLKEYYPYGNPGPGKLARVVRFQTRAKRCVYTWNRERLRRNRRDWDESSEIRATFACGADELLNVSAYRPGDFRQFFDDPRTRADYLRWAPALLIAEEYHAGNRKVED